MFVRDVTHRELLLLRSSKPFHTLMKINLETPAQCGLFYARRKVMPITAQQLQILLNAGPVAD